MSTQQISRRRMLKLAALGVTGTLLAACGGAPSAGAPAPTAASAAQAPAASTGAQGKRVIMSAGNADQNASPHGNRGSDRYWRQRTDPGNILR